MTFEAPYCKPNKLVLVSGPQTKAAAANLAVHSRRTDGKTVTASRMNAFSGEAAFSSSCLMAVLWR